MKKLSVIIIGRNEERHIDACLRSIVKGIRMVPDSEIIYADSASTDRTVEIVKTYPVRILLLRPEWPLCAAAGRTAGYRHAEGEFLFFIDGDTMLYHDWLRKGIAWLESHPETGGVAGSVHEIFEDENGRKTGFLKHRYGLQTGPRTEKTLGGIALFRKSVLDQTGPFNPFIAADEEPELCMRIRHAGHTLVRIPDSMALTFGPPRQTVRELFRRYRSRLYTFGTTLKYCQRNRMAMQYISERLDHIVTYLMAMAGFLVLTLIAIARGLFLRMAAGIVILVVLLRIFRPNLFHRLYISFIKRSLMTLRTFESYFYTKTRDMDTYPDDVTVIEPESRA
ncbi:glycosyltransferase [bacterium]|nr:glycosyltransferase [bacterium]